MLRNRAMIAPWFYPITLDLETFSNRFGYAGFTYFLPLATLALSIDEQGCENEMG